MNKVKVVLVGEAGVGKTCICDRLTHDTFNSQTNATVGVANFTYKLKTGTKDYTFDIWDTAGQEKYRSLTPMYYTNAQVAIMVFDLTIAQTLINLDEFYELLRSRAPSDCILVVVGNKADRKDDRAVSEEEGENYAARIGAIFYIETSATTGQGIRDLFEQIATSNAIPVHEDEEDFVAQNLPPDAGLKGGVNPYAKKDCC